MIVEICKGVEDLQRLSDYDGDLYSFLCSKQGEVRRGSKDRMKAIKECWNSIPNKWFSVSL